MYNSKCPKCREELVLGFTLNVNTVLWNTIQILFPQTKQAPASPTTVSAMRRVVDVGRRERLRNNLITATERSYVVRSSDLDHSPSHQLQETEELEQDTYYYRYRAPGSLRSQRRLRMSSTARVMSNSPTGVFLRGRPVYQRSLQRNQALSASPTAVSQGDQQIRSRYITEERRNPSSTLMEEGNGLLESFAHSIEPNSPLSDRYHSSSLNPSLSAAFVASTVQQEQMGNIQEEPLLEALESEGLGLSEHRRWYSPLNNRHQTAARVANGHGFGVSNVPSRRNSYSIDNDSEVEYVAVRTIERSDHERSSRQPQVCRLENRTANRAESQENRRRQSLLRRIQSVPIIASERFDDPDTDLEDASAGSMYDVEEDLDLNMRVHQNEEETMRRSQTHALSRNSRLSTSASFVSNRERRLAGLERLYDISSQIEAAMNDIERMSARPSSQSHRPVSGSSPSHQPTTPMTHRSCYEASENNDHEEVVEEDDNEEEGEEEVEDENVDWNARLHDAVFLLDDLDSTSEFSQNFNDIEQLSGCISLDSEDSEWVSSYDDEF